MLFYVLAAERTLKTAGPGHMQRQHTNKQHVITKALEEPAAHQPQKFQKPRISRKT